MGHAGVACHSGRRASHSPQVGAYPRCGQLNLGTLVEGRGGGVVERRWRNFSAKEPYVRGIEERSGSCDGMGWTVR